MEESLRGRHYLDKLDKEATKFAALHSLFKKLVKAEEVALTNRVKFQKKWEEIATTETIEDLSTAFQAYAQATYEINNAHRECIDHLKTVIQEGLRNYPIKIKQQKRSLSSRRSSEQQASAQRSQSLSRGDSPAEGPQRTNTRADLETEAFLQSVESYEKSQVEDIKMTLVHLVNTDMHQHAVALQQLSLVVPAINNLSGRNVKLKKSE